MHLHIHAIGTLSESWLVDGIAHYHKRIPKPHTLTIHSLVAPKRDRNKSIATLKTAEAKLLTQNTNNSDMLIYLDAKGSSLSSDRFAACLEQWQQRSSHIRFLIGGADGHDAHALAKADHILSLSKMTLPHGLARLILVEQIYRAIMIHNNHPYHR